MALEELETYPEHLLNLTDPVGNRKDHDAVLGLDLQVAIGREHFATAKHCTDPDAGRQIDDPQRLADKR